MDMSSNLDWQTSYKAVANMLCGYRFYNPSQKVLGCNVLPPIC